MKELDLRKDYPKWDWLSTTKRATAYDALINKKNTSLFAKSVWNDMVDCLNDALVEVGLTWNDTIASLSNTKFNDWFIFDLMPQTFTARMFNSVRYNMEKLFSQTFIWEYDENYEGYVGRSNYRGVNDANNPDTLYGSAIIELARKINVVIDVLKDEANIISESSNIHGNANVNVNLVSPEIERLNALFINSMFAVEGSISEAVPKRFNVNGKIKSYGSGKIYLKNAESTFRTDTRNISLVEATLILEELYKNLYSTIFHYATARAHLEINYHGINARVQIPNYMIHESNLTIADIIEMLTRVDANETDNVNLECRESLNIRIREVAGLVADALLSNAPEKRMSTNINGFSHITCKVENFKGSTFVSIAAHRETDKSRLNQGVSRRIISQISTRATMSIPQLVRCVIDPMIPEVIECISNMEGMINKSIAKYISGISNSELSEESLLTKNPARQISIRCDAFNVNTNIELEALLIRVLEINKRYQAEFNSQLEYVSKMLARGNAASSFDSDTRMELFTTSDSFIVRESFGPGFDVRLEALNYENYPVIDENFGSLFDVNLENIEPFPVRIDELFESISNSLMTIRDASETSMVNKEAFKHTIESSMSIVNLGIMSLDVKHDALLVADISFDPASWLNPVQTDTDIEVYQVYGSELNNKNLHLE